MMTQEEFMDVLAMKRAGMTYAEIGTQTGYHPATIAKWCREGGPPPARTTAETDRRVDRVWADRLSALLVGNKDLLAAPKDSAVRIQRSRVGSAVQMLVFDCDGVPRRGGEHRTRYLVDQPRVPSLSAATSPGSFEVPPLLLVDDAKSIPGTLISAIRRLQCSSMADNTFNTANQLVAFFVEPPKKPPKSVGIELLPISLAQGFSLPGPAVTKVVYVRHPVIESELIPFADYDERLAKDRYQEALRVFTKLGAARIVAKSHSQTTHQGHAKFGRKGFNFGFGAKKDAGWSLAADLEGDGARPIDPRPLRFHDIAGLDAVCEGVLNNGWRKGNIHVTQSSSLGVDGELAGALKKAGFTLGLGGSKAQVTDFVIEAAFTPETAKLLDAVVAATEPTPVSRSLHRRKSG